MSELGEAARKRPSQVSSVLDEAGEAGALAALARLGEERLQMPAHYLVQDGALRLAPPADAGRAPALHGRRGSNLRAPGRSHRGGPSTKRARLGCPGYQNEPMEPPRPGW